MEILTLRIEREQTWILSNVNLGLPCDFTDSWAKLSSHFLEWKGLDLESKKEVIRMSTKMLPEKDPGAAREGLYIHFVVRVAEALKQMAEWSEKWV